MTFETFLFNSGFTYDHQAGSFFKEDDNQYVHTFMQDDDVWSYECYDLDDNVVDTEVFNIPA